MEQIIEPSANLVHCRTCSSTPINPSLSGPMRNDLIPSSSFRLPGNESEEFLIGRIDMGSASKGCSRAKPDELDGLPSRGLPTICADMRSRKRN
jgi:hypothetical protein